MPHIYTHPFRDEAVTIDVGILTRWGLDNGRPRLLNQTLLKVEGLPPLAIALNDAALALPAPTIKGDKEVQMVEIRRWDDLAVDRVLLLPESGVNLTAFAFSPDGRWLATADFHERIYLIDRMTGQVADVGEGGEYTSALAFSPDSLLLAAVCTFQAGGYVSVWHVGDQDLEAPPMQLDRSGLAWRPGMDFADTFGRLSFSPDARQLAVCVTSRWLQLWLGWQGEIALYDVGTGLPAWRVPLNDQVDGESFYSDLVFMSQENAVLRGSLLGDVVVLNRTNGATMQRIPTGEISQTSTLARDRLGRGVWTIGSNGAPLLIAVTN